MRWGMVIDVRRCVGCPTCTIAPKQEYGLAPGSVWRFVADCDFGVYPTSAVFLPMMEEDSPAMPFARAIACAKGHQEARAPGPGRTTSAPR